MTASWARGELNDAPECETHFSNDSGHDLESFIESVSHLPERVIEIQNDERCWDVSVVFTTDERLRQLHADHLGDDTLTDVITFNYGSADDAEDLHFGEIVISVDRAVEQAAGEAWSLDDELTFILVHGLLHLCGWDDQTEEQRAAMHQRQLEIMERLQAC